jgi:plastocyanin
MQNAWIWIVVLVVIVVGGFIWWQSSQSSAPAPTTDVNVTDTTTPVPTATTSSSTTSTDTSGSAAAGGATISYDGKSFSPSTVTIKKGETVTWNDTSGTMWVASAPHPAHTGYDGTSRTAHCAPGYTGAAPFDQCVLGSTYTFTFDKVGTWPYHDHMNATAFGKVVVTE